MKTIYRLMMVSLAMVTLACVTTACGDDGDGDGGSKSVSGLKFKKANIAGAKMLALTSSDVAMSRGEGDVDAQVASMLYKMNDNGVLEEVTYTIEVKSGDSETAEVIQTRMRLDIEDVLPIGDRWLWLKDCKYACPTLNEVKDQAIRDAIKKLLIDWEGTYNYLVRTSDGALFEWTFGQGCPGSNMTLKSRAQYLYGSIEPYGDGILSTGAQNIIFQLKDKGNTMDVVTVSPTSIYAHYVMPTNEGYIGTELMYSQNLWEPYIIMPNTYQVLPINLKEGTDYDNYTIYEGGTMASVGGELYISRIAHKKQGLNQVLKTSFYKVKVANGEASADELIAETDGEVSFLGRDKTGLNFPVFKGTTMSWLSNSTVYGSNNSIYTFDPKKRTLTERPLPAHYPKDATEYFDGVTYVVETNSGTLPQSYWRCDLSKDEAEEIPLSWASNIQPYLNQMVLSSLRMSYAGASQSLLGTCMLLDGRKLSFRADVEGTNKGKVSVLLEGEKTAGQVVSVMVRLN